VPPSLTEAGDKQSSVPHDEALKKLLQTFFAEFIALFFPELDELLDYRETRFLMQELLVDIVGEEARHLDLLLELKLKENDAFVLIHLEPQSYSQDDFNERMFIYFSRLFERHRKEHKLIIPIAIFTSDNKRLEPDTVRISIPGRTILQFTFLQVKIRSHNWRQFVDSDNPVAAALLAKMGYNRGEAREVRLTYLRMMLRLRSKLDRARLSLVMSVADLYFKPDQKEDASIMEELRMLYPEEGEALMDLMPAWKRWGYEEGMEEGLMKGIEKGIETGMEKGRAHGLQEGKEEERRTIIQRLAAKGFSPEDIAEALELPVAEVRRLAGH
jgi:predicted transposase YdaD